MQTQSDIEIITFYHFVSIPEALLEKVSSQITEKCKNLNIQGLFILATEGFNSTLSGSSNAVTEFQKYLEDFVSRELKHEKPLTFKRSLAKSHPFRTFKVKIRPEIVTLKTPHLKPDNQKNRHLSPEEWNKTLKSEEDYVLIDTRNWYETQIGKFKGAIEPNIEVFTDFPQFVKKANIPKEKKVLMYCTGGIRCEKALLQMQEEGYSDVYQLDGGILNYLKEYPDDQYEGECFVFDHRVAVDQQLQCTEKYGLCPHCGQPSSVEIQCVRCDTLTKLCAPCHDQIGENKTCSKNCAYHFQRSGQKGARQALSYEFRSTDQK